jgi:hypothetical protein
MLRRSRVLYKRRRDNLNGLPDGTLLVRADAVYSYVEGGARYVENMFLVDPGYHPDGGGAPDARFGGFRPLKVAATTRCSTGASDRATSTRSACTCRCCSTTWFQTGPSVSISIKTYCVWRSTRITGSRSDC